MRCWRCVANVIKQCWTTTGRLSVERMNRFGDVMCFSLFAKNHVQIIWFVGYVCVDETFRTFFFVYLTVHIMWTWRNVLGFRTRAILWQCALKRWITKFTHCYIYLKKNIIKQFLKSHFYLRVDDDSLMTDWVGSCWWYRRLCVSDLDGIYWFKRAFYSYFGLGF